MQFASDDEYQNYRRELEARRSAALGKVEQAASDLLSGRITEKEASSIRLDADKVLGEYYAFAQEYCSNSGRLPNGKKALESLRLPSNNIGSTPSPAE